MVIEDAPFSGFPVPELYDLLIGELQCIIDIIPNQLVLTNGVEVCAVQYLIEKKGQIGFLQGGAGGKAALSATDTVGSFFINLWLHMTKQSYLIPATAWATL